MYQKVICRIRPIRHWHFQSRSFVAHQKLKPVQAYIRHQQMTTTVNFRNFVQPEKPEVVADSKQNEVRINLKLDDGTVTSRSIVRSFPKAKPTKLVSELERLLSPSSPSPAPTQNLDIDPGNEATHQDSILRGQRRWILNDHGNAISTTLLIPENQLNRIIQLISHESDDLQHHPHISQWLTKSNSFIVCVTCTTHQPPGLSMRDVKLADRIEEIITQHTEITGLNPGEERYRDIIHTLMAENVRAAEEAVANPSSKCALHVQAVQSSVSKWETRS